MDKEELENEANKWADDMVWALVDMNRKANDDERDFLVQEYKDLQKRFTAELEAQIEKMKCCINDLVHLGEFNEHTDEEYFNYQVHEALNNAGQFIKEIKENDRRSVKNL